MAKAVPEPNSNNQAIRINAELKPEGAPRYFTEMINALTVEGSDRPAFA